MLCFVKIVRIEYFSIKTNTKQAKFSCFKALLFVGIKNLHLLTKFRHFRVSIKRVFLPTYNAQTHNLVSAVFRLVLSKLTHQHTTRRPDHDKPLSATKKGRDSSKSRP